MLDFLSHAPLDLPGGLEEFLQQPEGVPGVLRAMLHAPPEGRSLMQHDRRRYPRVAYRGLVALRPVALLSGLHREDRWHYAITKNVSLGGLALFHIEQLYPTEPVVVVLLDTRLREMVSATHCAAEVSRCRRVAEGCFEIGAAFIQEERCVDESPV